MSRRKTSLLLLLSSGYLVAMGCSLFGPLRLDFCDILGGFGG